MFSPYIEDILKVIKNLVYSKEKTLANDQWELIFLIKNILKYMVNLKIIQFAPDFYQLNIYKE